MKNRLGLFEDPFAGMEGEEQLSAEAKKIALGLDKPFYVQYFVWLGQLLHGNLGYSIKSSQASAR